MMPLNFNKSTLTFSGKNVKATPLSDAIYYDEEKLPSIDESIDESMDMATEVAA